MVDSAWNLNVPLLEHDRSVAKWFIQRHGQRRVSHVHRAHTRRIRCFLDEGDSDALTALIGQFRVHLAAAALLAGCHDDLIIILRPDLVRVSLRELLPIHLWIRYRTALVHRIQLRMCRWVGRGRRLPPETNLLGGLLPACGGHKEQCTRPEGAV